MQKFLCVSWVVQLASFLVLFPNPLQASSFWMSNFKRRVVHERWENDVSNDVSNSNKKFVSKPIQYLDKFRNKAFKKVSNSRHGFEYPQIPSHDEVHLNHQYEDSNLNCDDNEFQRKMKILQTSLILGSIGLAFSKIGLVSIISPLLVVENTTTSTSTTSTTTTTIPTTTTSTTTQATTISTASTTPSTTSTTPSTTTSTTLPTTTSTSMTTLSTTTTSTTTTTVGPVSCTTTTTATTGDYKTIRNPGNQIPQCLAITVAVGSKIQITCTSIYTQAGTYTMFYTISGTTLISGTAVVGTVYTSTDNTLTIESLAGSANAETLCCPWTTV